MTASEERQIKRIEVLKSIAKIAEFNPAKVVYAENVFETNKSLSQSDIVGHVFYFREKGYLQLAPLGSNGLPDWFAWAKITSKGIDLIEKLEDGRDTTEYENDFSKQVLNNYTMNIGSVNYSPFQIATQNSNQTINSNESNLKELITILEKVKAAEPAPKPAEPANDDGFLFGGTEETATPVAAAPAKVAPLPATAVTQSGGMINGIETARALRMAQCLRMALVNTDYRCVPFSYVGDNPDGKAVCVMGYERAAQRFEDDPC